jgi:hypothetical protein
VDVIVLRYGMKDYQSSLYDKADNGRDGETGRWGSGEEQSRYSWGLEIGVWRLLYLVATFLPPHDRVALDNKLARALVGLMTTSEMSLVAQDSMIAADAHIAASND